MGVAKMSSSNGLSFQQRDLIANALSRIDGELLGVPPSQEFVYIFRAESRRRHQSGILSEPEYAELSEWFDDLVDLLRFWKDLSPDP